MESIISNYIQVEQLIASMEALAAAGLGVIIWKLFFKKKKGNTKPVKESKEGPN